MLRNGNKPLVQVAKRIYEKEMLNDEHSAHIKYPFVMNEKKNENHILPYCKGVFAKLNVKDRLVLKNTDKDKWFLTVKYEIVAMENSTFHNGKIYIYGKSLKKSKFV